MKKYFYDENVIEIYENNSKKYDEKHSDEKEMIEELIFFIKTISGDSVLDIGCGPGRDMKYFENKGLDVSGVDLCNSFLEMAKEKVPTANLYKQDIRDLKFEKNSFDGIWACASLLHISKNEIESVIETIYDILRVEGLVYISLKKGSGESIGDNNNYERGRFFAYYQEAEIKKILKKFNFKIVDIYLTKNGNNGWINVFARKINKKSLKKN